jgi:hypothetical protein
MSEMKTQPVFLCRRCGTPVVVNHLSTATSDPEGKLLSELMKGLGKIALCPYHQAQRDWYAQQGRMEDWEAGRP